MRIGLISYEYPQETGFGGIGTYVHQAAQMLAERGHEVDVFAGAVDQTKVEYDGSVKIHRAFPKAGAAFHQAIAPLFQESHLKQPFEILEGPEFNADLLSIQQQFPALPQVVKLHKPTFLLQEL
ncbi:MAG: glycosyltransferase, partial [Phaeodactylibacter sp.]|nr:glycosyltransferase [Phaeodactylibacter sp.]